MSEPIIDLALLRVIKYKDQLDKVYRYIPNSAVDKRTRAIAGDVHKYFTLHPTETVIDFPAFRSLFFTSWHKNFKEDDLAYYNKVLTRMETDAPEEVAKNLINQLLELEFATSLGNLVDEYQAGDEVDIVRDAEQLLKKTSDTLMRTKKFEFAGVEDNTINEGGNTNGYNWHIDCMNTIYRPMQAGDQYIVAARPGLGKTTFLTHLNAVVAPQLPDNKVIVWFNNESRRQRIMSRQIQSTLNMTDDQLRQLQKEGTLTQQYLDVMGRADRVRVYDIHGMAHYQLEEIAESIGLDNIGLFIFDMLDSVEFPMKGELREDQRLEKMYQWSRELGVKYNCPVFPTSQVSNEGAELMYPLAHMLKDSKTGKQGACDGIIMIGSDCDPTNPKQRGLSMPKTKSKREGQQDMREIVLLDEDRGRYV